MLVHPGLVVGDVSMHCKENGNGSVEIERSNGGKVLDFCARRSLPIAVAADRKADTDCSSEGFNHSTGSSQGSSRKMESPGWYTEENKRGLSPVSLKALERVVTQVIDRVRAYGYNEEVCRAFRDHFARLPARYTLNIDPQRHEDVLLHMELLQEAREADSGTSCRSAWDNSCPLPQVSVRKVQLGVGSLPGDGLDCTLTPSPTDGTFSRPGVHIRKPTFGSSSNLACLGTGGSPNIHPSGPAIYRSYSTPPRGTPPVHATSHHSDTSPGSSSLHHSIPRRTCGHFVNPLHMDEEPIGYKSDHEGARPIFGYEITIATSDRHGLLKYFTSALSNLRLQLNIEEAHVFSTTDGMALQVFVVEGWPGDEVEELKEAALVALADKLGLNLGRAGDGNLRAAAEALHYEDWAVDFNLLQIGEQLGHGSIGRLYKGKYLSQDVAIKVIEIDVSNGNSTGSDTYRIAPATERLQIYKQEVSIMRMVRHKNVVQFIGACSKWPKLCIVTELMAGGSVRDVLENRMSGLDIASAVKVLGDAARGMDFLHKRGIVHRDLKAANLLIDEHDVVKVCDFGVARLKPISRSTSDRTKNLAAEMTAETGTYRWMSPEVLEHKPYDHKADVYSFGITMWEVLTGEVPYAGLTPLQAAVGVVQRGLRPEILHYIPENLSSLIQQCWHEDPTQRPEFVEVLTALEEMTPTPLRRVMKTRPTIRH